jgi:tRNA 2-thiocytidine biosynthesis protein TtcA
VLEKSELRTVEGQLARAVGRCVGEFELIAPGDRVMVCMSGGKDSYTMLCMLERFRRKAPFEFELLAVHLDQGQPGYDGAPLRRWLEESGIPFRILCEDTYSTVIKHVPEGKTYCSLCSRLRRGVLYNAAEQLACSKIALGHHRDDAIETLLLNLIYTGALSSMPPKLHSRDGRNTVIRPLLYAHEPVIARYAELMRFPILPCDLCGSQEQLKRKQVKRLLGELEQIAPQARESMLGAMGNVKPAHLLDARLWRALSLAGAEDVDESSTGAPGSGVSGCAIPQLNGSPPSGIAPGDAQVDIQQPSLLPARDGARRLPLLR